MYITTETLRTMLRIAEEAGASLLDVDPVRNGTLSTFGVRIANGDTDPDSIDFLVRDEGAMAAASTSGEAERILAAIRR